MNINYDQAYYRATKVHADEKLPVLRGERTATTTKSFSASLTFAARCRGVVPPTPDPCLRPAQSGQGTISRPHHIPTSKF
jgi:hypothetical protein